LPPIAYWIKHIQHICALPGQANYGNCEFLNGGTPYLIFFSRPGCDFPDSAMPVFFSVTGAKIEDHPAASCGVSARYRGSNHPRRGWNWLSLP
jgi:hypothetical protein